ncbi:hypothetical protein AYW79_04235 [Ferroacidibacillus organovorans]|uniref:Uncharacterized protein n=1 Tax=Ferroacidibacillus organovorans TaxID=1765683 RepID=A0A853KE66_9BACL|nr:hypothetical protein AYJ22_03390 [Ferroacidibacillus organovorans]OAG94654.1 hypothetical protein AYW79_04235 [Ferroacidibacillus organovorans]
MLTGRSAAEVMDALVEAVRPVDGTQDSEASRHAIRNSMSEMLDRFPEANPVELSEVQRMFIIERYVALDIYDRFVLDVGKAVQDKAPNPSTALSRLKDIKDYIKEIVSARFRATRASGQSLGSQRIVDVVRNVLKETFGVFEEYVQ